MILPSFLTSKKYILKYEDISKVKISSEVIAILALWHFIQRAISVDTLKMEKARAILKLDFFFSRISIAYVDNAKGAFYSCSNRLRNSVLKFRVAYHTVLNI